LVIVPPFRCFSLHAGKDAPERAIAADCEFRTFPADEARNLPAADPGIEWKHIRTEIRQPTGALRSANGMT